MLARGFSPVTSHVSIITMLSDPRWTLYNNGRVKGRILFRQHVTPHRFGMQRLVRSGVDRAAAGVRPYG